MVCVCRLRVSFLPLSVGVLLPPSSEAADAPQLYQDKRKLPDSPRARPAVSSWFVEGLCRHHFRPTIFSFIQLFCAFPRLKLVSLEDVPVTQCQRNGCETFPRASQRLLPHSAGFRGCCCLSFSLFSVGMVEPPAGTAGNIWRLSPLTPDVRQHSGEQHEAQPPVTS